MWAFWQGGGAMTVLSYKSGCYSSEDACVLANDKVIAGSWAAGVCAWSPLIMAGLICCCSCYKVLFFSLGNAVVWTWCCPPAAASVWVSHSPMHSQNWLVLSFLAVLKKPVNHAGCIFPTLGDEVHIPFTLPSNNPIILSGGKRKSNKAWGHLFLLVHKHHLLSTTQQEPGADLVSARREKSSHALASSGGSLQQAGTRWPLPSH